MKMLQEHVSLHSYIIFVVFLYLRDSNIEMYRLEYIYIYIIYRLSVQIPRNYFTHQMQ